MRKEGKPSKEINKSVVIKHNMDKYEDIINLPHHQSLNHKRMSNYDRAAQFAPFAALTGYDALIKETRRQTNQRITLSNDEAAIISSRLLYLKEHMKERIIISLTFFKKDKKKDGGAYLTINGYIQSFDDYHKSIKINDEIIKISDIYEIESDIFSHLILSQY